MSGKAENIYLVGLMGAGKTTIGKVLARRLGWRFVDSDHEIEARTGVRIPTIFEIEGEEGFRRRETQVLRELTGLRNVVMATGGGAVIAEENRRLLRDHGLVVYLDVSPAQLYERTRHDRNRPLLQVADPLRRLQELLAAREPFYREVADIVVDGNRCNAQAVVQLLTREHENLCNP
ncbi:shikimate kinase [Azospira restricta]|uniref:Shikimate kinase n=2 Tax=Azospira restricta TaxID=404405 RepID=A0A974SQW4_9RHOO|nr:shikimate kinase [Azospira restricta]